MSITTTCVCGKKLSVPDDAAGRRARCPACNAVVQVPGTPPEPPRPAPEPPRATDKVDEVLNAFTEDLAKSHERAPEMTQIAKAMLVWAGVVFLLTLLAAFFGNGAFVFWLAVYLPQSVAVALLAVGMIQARPITPVAAGLVLPALFGVNYTTFWSWANAVSGWGALYFIVSVLGLGGYGFLWWYFRQPGIASIFASPADENSSATKVESKGTSAS